MMNVPSACALPWLCAARRLVDGAARCGLRVAGCGFWVSLCSALAGVELKIDLQIDITITHEALEADKSCDSDSDLESLETEQRKPWPARNAAATVTALGSRARVRRASRVRAVCLVVLSLSGVWPPRYPTSNSEQASRDKLYSVLGCSVVGTDDLCHSRASRGLTSGEITPSPEPDARHDHQTIRMSNKHASARVGIFCATFASFCRCVARSSGRVDASGTSRL